MLVNLQSQWTSCSTWFSHHSWYPAQRPMLSKTSQWLVCLASIVVQWLLFQVVTGISSSNLSKAVCDHWLLHQFAQHIMQINKPKSFLEAHTYPAGVLVIPCSKENNPICKCFECVGGKPPPDSRNLSIKESPSYIIQFTAHSNFPSQGLERRWEWECQPGAGKPDWFPLVAASLLTRCSSANDFAIRMISLLKRSSSCNSTTVVGDISGPKPFRIWSRSNTCGILFSISLATFAIYSSRLIPVPVSPATRMV